MKGYDFEDFRVIKDMAIGDIYIDLTNKELHYFKIDKQASEITIEDQSPNIILTLRNTMLAFDLDYDMYSFPDFIRDQGTLSANISGGNITISLTPQST